MAKNFKEFILRTLLNINDYIVGYDGNTGEEIRIPAAKLAQKGDAGASAYIQFSQNGENWHYPALTKDSCIRFRVGNDPWSMTFNIIGKNGIPGISAEYASNAENWHNIPQEDDLYIRFQLADNSWTQPIKAFGIDGENGANIELQKSNTHVQWRLVGDGGWINLIALEDLMPLVNATEEIAEHNVDVEAHKDIRNAIPTNTNQLTNGAGFITTQDIPTFKPTLITKSITSDTLTPADNTYYEYTNALTSLSLKIADRLLPNVIWFKSGTTPTTLTIEGESEEIKVLIPEGGLEIKANKNYEISIIKSRVSILNLVSL